VNLFLLDIFAETVRCLFKMIFFRHCLF